MTVNLSAFELLNNKRERLNDSSYINIVLAKSVCEITILTEMNVYGGLDRLLNN